LEGGKRVCGLASALLLQTIPLRLCKYEIIHLNNNHQCGNKLVLWYTSIFLSSKATGYLVLLFLFILRIILHITFISHVLTCIPSSSILFWNTIKWKGAVDNDFYLFGGELVMVWVFFVVLFFFFSLIFRPNPVVVKSFLFIANDMSQVPVDYLDNKSQQWRQWSRDPANRFRKMFSI